MLSLSLQALKVFIRDRFCAIGVSNNQDIFRDRMRGDTEVVRDAIKDRKVSRLEGASVWVAHLGALRHA
jgi:hypothetical protein